MILDRLADIRRKKEDFFDEDSPSGVIILCMILAGVATCMTIWTPTMWVILAFILTGTGFLFLLDSRITIITYAWTGIIWGLYFLRGNTDAIYVAIISVIIGEIFFWKSKAKPNKKESIFWFTVGEKIANIGEATIIMLGAYSVYRATGPLAEWLGVNKDNIMCFIGTGTVWVLAGIAVLGVIYAYVRLNALKYRKLPVKVKRGRGRPRMAGK